MSYDVITISPFDKQAKRLIKKFPSFKDELSALIKSLKNNPTQGTALIANCYKIRLAIKSKGKGKSGGARLITHVVITETTVILLSMYDKSEQANISDADIRQLLDYIQ